MPRRLEEDFFLNPGYTDHQLADFIDKHMENYIVKQDLDSTKWTNLFWDEATRKFSYPTIKINLIS